MTIRPTLADTVYAFTATWTKGQTIGDIAPALACAELTPLINLLAAAGHTQPTFSWVEDHEAGEAPGDCDGHTVPEMPLYDAHDRYTPTPGTEYPFSVSDIARAAIVLLGPDWHAESGAFGATGTISGPSTGRFGLLVDGEGDLLIEVPQYEGDDWPESPELPDGIKDYDDGVYLEGASASDGLDSLAAKVAAAVRAVTGR
ncbi:hypothetical protein ACWDXD_24840 [Streptomyces sp. NPDC003314]